MINEEFLNDTRKELDAKIDKKVSNTLFYWILGILLAALGGFFTLFMNSSYAINEKFHAIFSRIAVVETMALKKK